MQCLEPYVFITSVYSLLSNIHSAHKGMLSSSNKQGDECNIQAWNQKRMSLFTWGKKKKIIFLSSLPREEKISVRNRAQWLFRIAGVPLTQWLPTGSPVISGCTGTGPCGVRTAVWPPELMNTKAQSQFVHH